MRDRQCALNHDAIESASIVSSVIKCLEKVQRSATKMVHRLRHLSYERRLRHLELTTLKERRIRGDLIETFKLMTGKENVDRNQFFLLSTCEYQLRGHTMKLSKQRTSLDVRKFSFSQRNLNFISRSLLKDMY